MRVHRAFVASLAVVLALAVPACGSRSHRDSLDLTVTAIAPALLPATHSVPFTAVGTGWGVLVGWNATITFTATSGTPFAGGTSATASVIGTVTSATTIEASSPTAAFCGLLVPANVSITAVTGDVAVSAGPIAVFFAPSVTTFAPNPVRATIADPFTLTGADFDPVGGLVDVRFTTATGTPFLGGTSAVVHVIGTITSPTTIVGTTPLAVTEDDFLASTIVTFGSGACAVGGPLPFRAPPIVRAVQSFPPVADDLFGQTFLTCIEQTMTIVADNLDPLSEASVYDAAIGPSKPIGSGVLGSPVVTVIPGAIDDTIEGLAPGDPDQEVALHAVVRVTNPDGQIGEFEQNGAAAPVVFEVSGALTPLPIFETPGESPGASIAINPTDPLNVIVATQGTSTATNTVVHVLVTKDGGGSWADHTVGPSTAESPDAQSDAALRTTPRVAFDVRGSAYLVYPIGAGQLAVSLSADGGETFSDFVIWNAGGAFLNPDIATGETVIPGRQAIYIAVINAGGVILLNHHSDAFGVFTFTTGIGQPAGGTAASQPAITVGPGGAEYVVWVEDVGGGTTEVRLAADLDGFEGPGVLGSPVTVDSQAGGPIFPAVEAAPQLGAPVGPQVGVVHQGDHIDRVVVSYTRNSGVNGLDPALDVVAKVSDDFGVTFFGNATQPVRVHPPGNGDQFGGALAADPTAADGRLYVTWYDTGPDPGGTLVTRWGASSTDGLQWTDPVRLTLFPTPGSNLTGAGSVDDYGFFQGVAALGGCAWAAWTQEALDPDSEPWVTRFQSR